ncbi:MAG: VWA domain-containing protein, partial [Planctomycetaceae bacterium]|nr:VWA domain-containing protein [Planctomycetaceae bacterium]
LSMLVLKQNDSVGVAVFDSQVRSLIPTSSRHNHLQQVLAGLSAETAGGKTDMRGVLLRVAESLSHRSIVILISDLFCDRDALFRGLQLLRQRKHEVLILHVMDDQELDFNYSGSLRFEGLEESGRLTCDPAALRAGYLQALTSFLETIRRRCTGSVIDYRLVRTSENL